MFNLQENKIRLSLGTTVLPLTPAFQRQMQAVFFKFNKVSLIYKEFKDSQEYKVRPCPKQKIQ